MTDTTQATLDAFITARPRLMSIAHRVMGNSADAEDVVQEAWIRWQRVDHETVRAPSALLATMTTRLALNLVTDAAHRHAHGGALPLDLTLAETGPEEQHEQHAQTEEGIRVLLAALSPRECALFILREGFDLPYDYLAGLTGSTEQAVRKVLSRARFKLREPGGRPVSPHLHREVVRAFRCTARTGDPAMLERVFGLRQARATLALAS